MAHVKGILVELRTATGSGSGTKDHIYIGVQGQGGGREFPLDVRGFNDHILESTGRQRNRIINKLSTCGRVRCRCGALFSQEFMERLKARHEAGERVAVQLAKDGAWIDVVMP